jgi:RNA polymerase sigma-70 factor (ECF subfamily)
VGAPDPDASRRRRDPAGDGLRGPATGLGGDFVAEPSTVVDRLFRHESGRTVATLIRILGDFDAAEEAVQEAFVVALERWPRDGVPANPGAWITRVARNKAIDRLRRERTLREKQAIVEQLESLRAHDEPGPGEEQPEAPSVTDDRLRLIFTCCHPALAPEARVALTLRTLGGLTTAEIARAFLVSEGTMARRLVRAKRKIRDARIPYDVPSAERLPERLPSVLATIYLVFNEGYLASSADSLIRRELCAEAIRLARVLQATLPREPEVRGLLALMLLHDSRRAARVDAAGELVLLDEQDRALWDRDQIEEGLVLAARSMGRYAGPYVLQAAIAAKHAQAPTAAETDWARIRRLYDRLAGLQPSPVIELNRAVAQAMSDGPAAGLERMERISGLEGYLPFHVARADLLRRLGDHEGAAAAYRRALELSPNLVQRSFLEGRLRLLNDP